MKMDMNTDEQMYVVVINVEEQYSVWPVNKILPLGWFAEKKIGTKPECLAYIKEIWLDMRPLSLRKSMSEQESISAN